MSFNKKQYNKQYYEANKEKIKQQTKTYRLTNRDKTKQYQKQYRLTNKIKTKQYRLTNREKLKEYFKQYQKLNKDKISEREKTYRLTNKTKTKQYRLTNKIKTKQYRLTNREKLKEYFKQYQKLNKDKRRKYLKNKYKINKNFRILILLRNRVQKTLTTYTKTGKISSSRSYGIDYQSIINYLSPLPENIQDYNLHHTKPLFTFNFINEDESTNLQEIKKAFAPENHKLLLTEDHRKLNHRNIC